MVCVDDRAQQENSARHEASGGDGMIGSRQTLLSVVAGCAMLAASAGMGTGAHARGLTTDPVGRTIPLADQPVTLTLDSARQRLFVMGQQAFLLNTRTGTRLTTLAWNRLILDVAVDERLGRIYAVASARTADGKDAPGSLGVFRAPDQQPISTVPVGTNPRHIAVDDSAGRVFVVNDGGGNPRTASPAEKGSLSILDAATGALLRTVPLGWAPTAAVVDRHTGLVFIGSHTGAMSAQGPIVTVINGHTGAVIRTLPLGAYGFPALTVSAGTDRVVATDGNTVWMLDAGTGAPRAVIHNTGGVAVADSVSKHIFVAAPGTGSTGSTSTAGGGSVQELDGRTGKILRIILEREGYWAPAQMVDDAAKRWLLILHRGPYDDIGNPTGPGFLSIVDIASGRTLRVLRAFPGDPKMVFDERTQHLFYIGQGASLGMLDIGAMSLPPPGAARTSTLSVRTDHTPLPRSHDWPSCQGRSGARA